MTRGLVVAVLIALSGAVTDGQARAGKGDPRFVGHWRLVSFVNFDAAGTSTPNRLTGGRIVYDAAGQMSAHLTAAKRPALPPNDATDAQRAASYSSYVAYYGAYTVDDGTRKVTHHVEGALNPNWPATDLVRDFEFAGGGNTLRLSTRNSEGRITGTLTWARIR